MSKNVSHVKMSPGESVGQRVRAVVVALLAPNEPSVRSAAVCIQRQVALFAHVSSPTAGRIDCTYLARSPTSQHDQGVVLQVVSFR